MRINKTMKILTRAIQRLKINLEIVVPLKQLSNFQRPLDMPLINYEVSLTLTWSENSILNDITIQTARAAQGDNPARPATINATTNATFKITDTQLYVPVLTLSTEDDNYFLEQLKSEFKRTIKWNKYKSEMINQTKTSNLIGRTFHKVISVVWFF